MARAPLNPLVAVVGATGTGKSDLAVEIARRYNGEIINGDAMQLYRGLPVITNKITQEETKGIPHHLLGCIGLEEETWTVGRFVSEALGIINEVRSRGKLPILVGGTHYYTQSLLFQDALADDPALSLDENSEKFSILEEDTSVILAKLEEVDPAMAERWHPNERRKIQRTLEIYLRTGKPASQLYSEQRLQRELLPSSMEDSATGKTTNLRFEPLIFWVHTDKGILYPRLDRRVDRMLANGLLSEVRELNIFRQNQESITGTDIDQSRGIWVSIGYKEFLGYQQALEQESSNPSELEQLKMAAIEKTQAATRQYANRQIKWIRIKLLNALLREGRENNIFLVDGSDLSRWQEDVVEPTTSITNNFLSGVALPIPSELSSTAAEMLTPKRSYDLGQRPDLWQKKVCSTCGTTAVTENDWNLHVKSRAHRRAVGVSKKQRNAENKPKEQARPSLIDVVDVLEDYLENFADKKDSNEHT